MPRAGHRYPLIVYEHTLNRWWPVTLLVGLTLLLLGWLSQRDPVLATDPRRATALWAVGTLALLFTLYLVLTRRLAYVQAFPDHLRLVTPFLRLKIAYRRILRTSTAVFSAVIPPRSLSAWRREMAEPLMPRTAVILEMRSWPVPPSTLRLFLSPFFFKDRSPVLILLVKDWMGFSAELESMRQTGGQPPSLPPRESILAQLPPRRRR